VNTLANFRRIVWLLALVLAAPIGAGADTMHGRQRGDYHGWPDTYTLSNGRVELAITTAIGPRIVDFRLTGGDNVFYLRPAELGKTGEAEWVFRGGWRLWVAPEEKETTYEPDNQRCTVEELKNGGVRVTGPVEPRAGIQKSVEVVLVAGQPRAQLVSRIKNVSDHPVRYAAWSLSVMRPGGRALVPLDIGDPSAFFDTRSLILWSYAKFADPRYSFGDRLVQVDQGKVQPSPPGLTGRRPDESKIGVDTWQGWASYLRENVLYVKRFPHQPGGAYTDGGATVEVYSSAEFLELENLSTLDTLKPGEQIVYPEEWSLYSGVSVATDEAGALRDLDKWLRQAGAIGH